MTGDSLNRIMPNDKLHQVHEALNRCRRNLEAEGYSVFTYIDNAIDILDSLQVQPEEAMIRQPKMADTSLVEKFQRLKDQGCPSVEIDSIITIIGEHKALHADAISALKRLVDLKAHKDAHGKNNWYVRNQKNAWKKAQQTLAAMGDAELTMRTTANGNALGEPASETVNSDAGCAQPSPVPTSEAPDNIVKLKRIEVDEKALKYAQLQCSTITIDTEIVNLAIRYYVKKLRMMEPSCAQSSIAKCPNCHGVGAINLHYDEQGKRQYEDCSVCKPNKKSLFSALFDKKNYLKKMGIVWDVADVMEIIWPYLRAPVMQVDTIYHSPDGYDRQGCKCPRTYKLPRPVSIKQVREKMFLASHNDATIKEILDAAGVKHVD